MRKIGLEGILSGLTILILLGVAGFFGYRWWLGRVTDEPRPEEFETAVVGGAIPRADEREVTKIAEQFVEYYIDAVAKGDEKDANRAKELLTERGQSVVDLTESPVEGLKKFTLGLADPDDVTILTTVRQSENFAEVASKWEYDTQALDRYFYFTKVDGAWRLDSVQLMQQ